MHLERRGHPWTIFLLNPASYLLALSSYHPMRRTFLFSQGVWRMFSLWTGQPLVFALRIGRIVAADVNLVWFLVMSWLFNLPPPTYLPQKLSLNKGSLTHWFPLIRPFFLTFISDKGGRKTGGPWCPLEIQPRPLASSISGQIFIFHDFPYTQCKIGISAKSLFCLGDLSTQQFCQTFFCGLRMAVPLSYCRGAGLRRSLTLTWIVSNRV